jgi:hypothetical protein
MCGQFFRPASPAGPVGEGGAGLVLDGRRPILTEHHFDKKTGQGMHVPEKSKDL